MTQKTKVVNLYGGPGSGKSTTAAGVFYELKSRGVNCEYVQEYAKDKAWEFGSNHSGTPKVIQAQEYIFAQQHFRMRRCAHDVDLIITDAPLLFSLVYMPTDFPIPSLRPAIREGYDIYDNLDIFIIRTKAYSPVGRFQTEEQAKALDSKILTMLDDQRIDYTLVHGSSTVVKDVVSEIELRFKM